jgi:hypothetical protein
MVDCRAGGAGGAGGAEEGGERRKVSSSLAVGSGLLAGGSHPTAGRRRSETDQSIQAVGSLNPLRSVIRSSAGLAAGPGW